MASRGTQGWRDNISRGRQAGLVVPAFTTTTEEVAWAAGFYEGEGSCHYRDTMRVGIVQVNPEPIDRMQRLFGGRQYRWVRRGGGYGYWQWQISGKRAKAVLNLLMPLLSARRQDQVVQAYRKEARYV